jgi:acyl-CoA thioesterase
LVARAWWAGELVAESSSALRVEQSGRPPSLYFPVQDVQLPKFAPAGADDSRALPLEAGTPWSIGRRPDSDHGPDGRDVLRTFTGAPAEHGWREGFATFDHDRVVVEVVDAVEGDDPRAVTVKRFPTWGDVSQLMEILDVTPDGDRRYRSLARASHLRAVVEGSQMLGQAIVAAGLHRPGRRAVSSHMVFMRPADPAHPLSFELDELSSGRSFTTVAVDVTQMGRRCATATLLLDVTAPDLIRHSAPLPDVPGPYECEPYDMSVTGRDVRVVDGAYTDDPDAPVGPPVIDAWVRFRDVPDDPCLHAALLAQFTGHMSIAAALRPHPGVGQREAHRTMSTAINAIGLSLHADIRADRWMLYHHVSTFAGDGMSRSECRVHDAQGALLASFSVDAMIRGFEGMNAPPDHRRSL